MMRRLSLMIPGPIELEHDVLSKMNSPMVAHYGREWVKIYRETVNYLKQIFQTKGDVFIVVGSGSAGLDAGIGSIIGDQEKILVITNGFFGDRLATIARSYTKEVIILKSEWNRAVAPADVRRFLKKEKGIRAIAVVHSETSTGVVNPVKEIGQISKEYNIPLIVDAISSLGGMELKMDEWGIDICVSASQKCLESPPGLSLIAVNQRAWDAIEKCHNSHPGWYLNLQTWKEYAKKWADWHPYPISMAVNNVLALKAALKKILSEGLDKRIARHANIAEIVRVGIRNIGFRLIAEDMHLANTLTGVLIIPGTSAKEVVEFLVKKYRIQIAGGIGDFKGKLFRIGHMGPGASLNSIIPVMFGIEDYLRSKGFKVPHGKSLIGI